jgi:hypothetical protein
MDIQFAHQLNLCASTVFTLSLNSVEISYRLAFHQHLEDLALAYVREVADCTLALAVSKRSSSRSETLALFPDRLPGYHFGTNSGIVSYIS